MKKCGKCREEKQFTDFYKNKTTKDGYGSSCKSCVKLHDRRKIAQRMSRQNGQHIYVITHPLFEGWVKIGRSKNVKDRLMHYQTGCPHRMYEIYYSTPVPDPLIVEQYMNNNFTHKGEWFNIHPEVAKQHIEKSLRD